MIRLNHPATLGLLAALLAGVLFSVHHFGLQSSDDAATLAASAALVERGTLAIPHMQWLDDRVDIGRPGPDGALRTKYGIGPIAASAALYALGAALMPASGPFNWAGYDIAGSAAGAGWAEYVTVPLGAAVVGLLAFELARRDGARAALVGAALLAVASPLWLSARGMGSEVGAALGLLWAAVAARRAESDGGQLWPALLGLGVAALFRPPALVFGAAWLIWLRGRPRRAWGAALIGALVIAAALAGYNLLRYGSPLESGYGDGGSGFRLLPLGLIGFAAAPGRGLLWFAPWALAAVPAALRAFREGDRADAGAALGAAAFVVLHAFWREWEGGWAYGPRLLVPVLPVLALLAAPWLARRPWLAAAAFALGALLQFAALPQDPLVTHTAVIVPGGLTLADTVWSLGQNITLHQLRAALASGPGWLIAWALAAAAAVVWALLARRGMVSADASA